MSTRSICPAPRIAWACESCRARRTRCLPSAEGAVCERCMKLHTKCVFPSRKQESKRLLNGRSQKSIQSNSSPTSSSVTDDILSSLTASPSSELAAENEVGALQAFHRRVLECIFPQTVSKTTDEGASMHSKCSALPFKSRVLAPQTFVTATQAKKYLQRFETLNRYFPFVILPDAWTVATMLTNHPFLMLGILSAMSQEDACANTRINTEFKRVLSDRVIMHGEKSLDLLQGFMVYLAWYPSHLNPRSMQLYQFLTMCCSMMTDLEYNLPPEQRIYRLVVQQNHTVSERRAYLGCYYLASALAMPKRRNPVIFTSYAEDCLSDFENYPTHELDTLVTAFVRLQNIDDDASWNANPNDYVHSLDLGRAPIEACLDSFTQRLQKTTDAQAYSLRNNGSTTFLHLWTTMKIHSLALRPEENSGLYPSGFPSQARLNALTACIHATKAVFEALVAMPPSEYRNFGMVDWSRLINAVILVLMLCSVTPTVPTWEYTAAKQKAMFSVYLESISLRMAELSRVQADNETPPDFFCMMESMLKIVRNTYTDMATNISEVANLSEASLNEPHAQIGLPRCPMFHPALKETEYWDAFTNDTASASHSIDISQARSQFGGLEKFDLTSWESWDSLGWDGVDSSLFGITVEQR